MGTECGLPLSRDSATTSFGHPLDPVLGPPGTEDGSLLHCGSPLLPYCSLQCGLRGTPAKVNSLRGISALAPGPAPPPPSSLTQGSTGIFISDSFL